MLPDLEIRRLAALMLQELRELKLAVCAVPDGRPNSSRKVRCAVVPNPDWYSRLCRQWTKPRPRKERTIIKRWYVIKRLESIIEDGINRRSEYDRRILESIEWCAANRGDLQRERESCVSNFQGEMF